ncbi:hypothetical protein LPJ56_000564 [Coemansia sp. RSA 2599]|nr:hypothetical protein LPJ75_003078 [Coemansia sp. RSA 2598]KAJ1829178.1 hypothetical protein LPJ56_000564 [Coemansia sp. RSA 2599]
MVHPSSKLLQNCIFTTVWLRSICGQMPSYGILTLYTIGVYFRYRKAMRFQGIAWWSLALVLLGINVAIGVIVSLMPTSKTIEFIRGMEVCNFNLAFKDAMVSLTWSGLAGLLVAALVVNLMVICKNGEAKEITLACFALVTSIVFHTAVFYRKPRYPASFAWRAAVVSVDQLGWFVAWWAVMGRSLYICAFRGDAWIADYARKIEDE